MSKRIYVGNLPWSTIKAKLEELFSSFGKIEDALVIADKYTGRSRGFGFVTFENDADADKAIKEMDRKDVDGRNIIVKEAVPLREQQEEEKSEEKQKESKEKPEKKPKEESTTEGREEESEKKPEEESSLPKKVPKERKSRKRKEE